MAEAVAGPVIEQEPDGRLLHRFAASRDEGAFAELVRRHGRLVWGVCRRRLARREDAEDAFQATFLILAVKAGSVRAADALPGWLYRTACRAAVRVASSAPGAPAEEVPSGGGDAFAELARYEAAVAVDEELVRLPRRYRDALVLFYLQELERKEVAERLGVSEAAVKALLARGRAILRTRLARRGVALPLVLPFLADPVPAAAAESACRLGVSLTRGGVSALDLITVPFQGAAPMVGWLTGKTAAVSVVGAACLTLFLAAHDPTGTASVVAGDAGVETRLAAAEGAKPRGGAAGDAVEVTAGGGPAGGATPMPTKSDREPIVIETPVEAKIRAELEQPTTLEFPNTPLRDALKFLADIHYINILIDEVALEEAGINIDENVDIVLKGITLRSGLEILFERHDMAYVIEDEVLKVTTEDIAERKVRTAAYDLSAVPGFQEEGFEMKLQSLLEPPAIAGTPGGTVGFGAPARVALFGDRLIVKGPRSHHEQIDEVLSLLRAGR